MKYYTLALILFLLSSCCIHKRTPVETFMSFQENMKKEDIKAAWKQLSHKHQKLYDDLLQKLKKKPNSEDDLNNIREVLVGSDCVDIHTLTGKKIHTIFWKKIFNSAQRTPEGYGNDIYYKIEKDSCFLYEYENKDLLPVSMLVKQNGHWKHESPQLFNAFIALLSFDIHLTPQEKKKSYFCVE